MVKKQKSSAHASRHAAFHHLSLLNSDLSFLAIGVNHYLIFDIISHLHQRKFKRKNATSKWYAIKNEDNVTTKGQIISKVNFEVFIWTKNERKYFSISALGL